MSPPRRTTEELAPYYCAATNPYTGRPCRTLLIQAWAPAGALVRRKCKRCNAWQLIRIRPADSETGADALD